MIESTVSLREYDRSKSRDAGSDGLSGSRSKNISAGRSGKYEETNPSARYDDTNISPYQRTTE